MGQHNAGVLFSDSETERLNALVERGARAWSADELKWLRRYVEEHMPPNYVEHQRGVRQRYTGHQREFIESALIKRFPRTHERMPRFTLPLLRFFAAADAGVYRLPPERAVVDESGADVEADDVKKRFAAIVGRAGLDAKMPEVERRAIAARTIFVSPRWQPSFDRTRPAHVRLDLYWPCDVGVVCHAAQPGNLDAALIVIARTSRPAPKGVEWFELWARSAVDDASGQPKSFTPWRVHLVSSDGEYLIPPDDDRTLYVDADGNPLPLPWCVVQLGEANGGVYVDEDRDLVDVVDSINVARSAEQYALDMQGHTPIVYRGNERKENEIAWGVDEITRIGGGEFLDPIELNPKLAEMRDSRTLTMRELGIVRRNPVGYALNEGAAVASGVARQIENEPHEAVLDENAQAFRDFEQMQLLPAILAVHNAFSGEPLEAAGFRVAHRRPPPPEDPEAKQRRVDADVAARRISPARGAVELGLYPDIASAVAKMGPESDKIAAPSTSTPPLFTDVANDGGGTP